MWRRLGIVFVCRRHRRPLAGWLILLLLFMQAATAAYACPRFDMMPDEQVAMPGCEESGKALDMDSEHPLLCIADCAQDARVPSAAAALDVPAMGGLLYQVALTPALPSGLSRLQLSTDPAARGDPPPGWPPPYLLHRVLRN